jgi:cytochrome d ubiquinol oxidase subunit II
MIVLHGSVYLAHRTVGAIQQRALSAARIFGVLLLVTFGAAGVWVATGIDGYVVTSAIDTGAMSAPMSKTVVRAAGAWMANYHRAPLTMALPALAAVATLAALVLLGARRTGLAFIASALAMAGIIGTVAAAMFPFIMPSSSVPDASLTVWDAVSSRMSLGFMLVATLALVPLILLYTSWAYRVMAGKVTAAYIRENEHDAY